MDTMSILWQISLILIILIFGVNMALSSKCIELNKRGFALTCIVYAGFIILLSWISSFYTKQLSSVIANYLMILYIVMALVLVYAGFKLIRNWDAYKHNQLKVFIILMGIPFICSIICILTDILIVGPMIDMNLLNLGIYSAILLVIVMTLSYFILKSYSRSKKPNHVVDANSMILTGEFFLLYGLIIPNIQLALTQTNGITINSSEYMGVFIILALLLLFAGIMINRKKSILK